MPLDDRGTECNSLTLRKLKHESAEQRERAEALLLRLKGASSRETRKWSREMVVFQAGGSIGLVLVLVLAGSLIGSGTILFLMFVGGLIALVVTSRALVAKKAAREVARTAVSEGFCGSCGYTLEGLDADSDACVVCPECGSAWQADRITQPHWSGPELRVVAPDLDTRNWLEKFLSLSPKWRDLMAPDDRGRYVCFVDARLRSVSRKRRRELGAERRVLKRQMRRVGRVKRLVTAVLVLVAGTTFALNIGLEQTEVGRETAAKYLLGAAIGLAILIPVSNMFLRLRDAGQVLLDNGRCASCVAVLSDDEPAGEFVVCGECGASWRVGRSSSTDGSDFGEA